MKDKNNSIFDSLCELLPCDKCKVHFKQQFDEHPLTTEILLSKRKLLLWYADIKKSITCQDDEPELPIIEATDEQDSEDDGEKEHYKDVIEEVISK